jgi:hypothetical protein
VIGLVLGEQLTRHLSMPGRARELEDDLVVPLEAEPFEAIDDGVDRGLGRALAVGILDAQPEDAAVMAGEQPVEQGGARPANMEEAGRRGGKAANDGHARAGSGWARAV